MFLFNASKRTKIVAAVIFIILLLAGAGFYIYKHLPQKQTAPQAPSQEDVARMVKPAVVHIVQHVTGTYALPKITIDLKTLTVAATRQRSDTTNIDEYITGSGFVINPDGYILTNSHVVSQKTLEYMLIEDAIGKALDEETRGMTDADLKNIFKTQSQADAFVAQAYDAVETASSFNLKSRVMVLNPSSDKEDLSDLFEGGFEAKVLSVNDKFMDDEKDVALIKINLNNLPAVPLAKELGNTGNKIFVFGFPATADFNQKSPLESTFTQGIISAIKSSQDKSFKVYQTDAKISEGSSGGPMFNEKGEVIGITTFQTGEVLRQAGDNFAFAVPVSLAQNILDSNRVTNEAGQYRSKFASGLQDYYAGRCKSAVEQFGQARKTSFYFVPEKYVNYYIDSCRDRIAAGKSLDNRWDRIKNTITNITPLAWFVWVGRILLVVTGLYMFWFFMDKFKRNEQKLNELENELERTEEELQDKQASLTSLELPFPQYDLHVLHHTPDQPHPHLLSYIREARGVGMNDDSIIEDLRRAGWQETEILKALNNA